MSAEALSYFGQPWTVEINGVKVSAEALVLLLNEVTRPDPSRWYRYERTGDNITVTVKQDAEFIQREQPA